MIRITNSSISRYNDYIDINTFSNNTNRIIPTCSEFTIDVTLQVSGDDLEFVQNDIQNNIIDFLHKRNDDKLNRLQKENKALKCALKSIREKYT